MNKKLKEGFIFTTLAQIANVFSVLAVNIILSHKLAPRDFGIITMVQVIATFINLFTGEAVPSAIIQNKQLARRDYSVLFNYSVVLGSVATLLFGLCGFVFAFIFNDTIYIPVSWVMSIMVLTSFLNCVPQGLFLKNMSFKALSIRRIVSSILGMAFGIGAVFLGAGLYAIAISLVVPAVFTLIFSLMYVKIPIIFSLEIKPLKQISTYMIEQTKFSVLNYGYRNIDNVLIGKFLGPTALGYYSKSYQLLSQPITLFLGVVTPVLQPVLSNYQDDVKYIRDFYMKFCRMVAFLAVPLSVFFALNSKEIVYFLFGHQWTKAILPMSILSLSIWVQLLSQIITPIWQSRNLPKIQTKNGKISFTLIALFICAGIMLHSVLFVAVAVSCSYYLNFLISAHLVLKYALESKLSRLLRILVLPVMSGIVSAVILMLVMPFTNFPSLFLTLFVRGIIWLLEVIFFLVLTGNLKDILSVLGK